MWSGQSVETDKATRKGRAFLTQSAATVGTDGSYHAVQDPFTGGSYHDVQDPSRVVITMTYKIPSQAVVTMTYKTL